MYRALTHTTMHSQYLKMTGGVLLILTLLVLPQSVSARHDGDPPPINDNIPRWSPINDSDAPCEVEEEEEILATSPYNTVAVSAPGAGGTVPVNDEGTHSGLEDLGAVLNALGEELEDIELILAENENEISRARVLLNLLCVKEYEEDHTLQHDWALAISLFTEETLEWINTAYDGVPIYVTNPYLYYRNIEIGVVNAFMQEVDDLVFINNLDPDIGRNINRQILERSQDRGVGELIRDWSADPASAALKAEFDNPNEFGRESFAAGNIGANNDQAAIATFLDELDTRRRQVREIESQKLNWGRGFFPWEICGDQVFSENAIDIRTCMTFTPGAVIQDLTSWILSSGLRQMELADEYEEWISGSAYYSMSTIFNDGGLFFADIFYPDLVAENLADAIPPPDVDAIETLIDDFEGDINAFYAAEELEPNPDKASRWEVDLSLPPPRP